MSASDATFPKLLRGLATKNPDQTALQEKRYGIWQPMSWSTYAARVQDFAHGLAALGVERGQIVAVLGDNRPEWLIAELAAQSIGAAVVGIYPTSIGEELLHILTLAQVKVVVAEDQEQVDKLLKLRAEAAAAAVDPSAATSAPFADMPPLLVDTVVFYDPHGLEQYTDECLRDFTAVEALGREWGATHPGWLDEQVARGTSSDIAVICTTSGTTSRPKLAELSHDNLLAMADHLTAIDPIDSNDRYVSFLPFAWIGEQMLAVACGLSRGLTLSFPEDSATQKSDMREIGPDVMFSPPRIWEGMLSEVQVRIDEAGWLKRKVFGWGYDVGDKAAGRRVKGQGAGALGALHWLADQVALRPVRDQLGLARNQHAYTGGAPLGPDVFRFFHAIGVNLKQIYGQTEICGIAVVHRDDDIAFNTVGTPIAGTEIQIADNGEILLRSASVFKGYHRNPAATAEAVDPEGWLHTGDAGYLDDNGHLVVIDRQKDVLTTADGTRFSSAFIENKLKFSPYVEEAVTFAADNGMTAIITIDPMTTGSWAEHERLSYTTYTDLAAKAEVQDLVAEEIHRANEDLPESIRVQRFVLLHKQFDPDDDEITRTRKVRRNVIQDRYGLIIDALNRGDERIGITTTVTYQDGTKVDRTIDLRIFDLTTYRVPEGRGRRPVWSGRR
ncbi:MAG TPA: AMP-binding protein [Dermatophilaceae bacterium]|jgi:long-chain acyl-CoA synthetase|uniref:Acyl-CoA synthetase n=1 Tax=Candidatus Phosphoribacter hodrii TaxID=2953743 RepID=A0A934X870_9MICO|nr:AMP-binding protein [Candidatus Phosphoribacter hodrii]MBP8838115.1 AMP-binding protein [Dermatophilaceae bacterium]MBL0005532.1 AMP-binding protein [Candidatus Phosphoribacter hodrii]HNV13401.1 AMP-binding protein [Dermatophilaceae bacterium]HOA01170.1 AMP-binding protein [Dermatophilaceae bacterium]